MTIFNRRQEWETGEETTIRESRQTADKLIELVQVVFELLAAHRIPATLIRTRVDSASNAVMFYSWMAIPTMYTDVPYLQSLTHTSQYGDYLCKGV